MCGIAGIVGEPDRSRGQDRLGCMTAALERRGPDDEGKWFWEMAGLGHRRLSIFDLSSLGHQPMVTADGRIGLVFNGAIYNFRVLRRELEESGYEFRSQTDTEVLLHGYRAWGVDRLVSKLEGMFAIGIWDDAAQRLYLIRDRLGVKPLYYAERGGRLVFASTARALRASGLVEELDGHAVAEFLEFGYVTDQRCIYRGAHKVPAATIVEWSRGEPMASREYWRPPVAVTSGGPSFEEAVEETERRLRRAVEKRLSADVPIGALLSSGIDSTLICAMVADAGAQVTAFTVSTPGDEADESPAARQIAQKLGIAHRVLESRADQTDVMELAEAFGEPFACASALGMLRLSQVIKQEATVLLTGDGGDDVFLGYPEHRHFWMAQRMARRLPAGAGPGWQALRKYVPPVGVMRRAAHFLDYATGGLGAVTAAHEGWPQYRKWGILGPRLLGAELTQRQKNWSSESAGKLLDEFLEYDRSGRFVGEYMTKVDGGTMHYALEARAPFLDQDLWAFAAALPYEIRLRGRQSKAILREIARRRVGPAVAGGRKQGFRIPVQRWVAGQWRKRVADRLERGRLASEGWVDGPAVQQLLAQAGAQGWAPNQLWYLYVLENWLQRERAFAPVGVS